MTKQKTVGRDLHNPDMKAIKKKAQKRVRQDGQEQDYDGPEEEL